ncbi:MAG: alpha/beta hydrolase [Candidatus Limnocylindria bacterium]
MICDGNTRRPLIVGSALPGGNRQYWGTRGRGLAAALVAVGFLACQSTPATTPDAMPVAVASPSSAAEVETHAASDAPGIAERIDIGGRSLYLECRGTGQPTILFLHGYGGSGAHGFHLFDYADRQMVCVYDRANMGRSDAIDGTQTGADIIDDLERLL